jgi:hypothetical protein
MSTAREPSEQQEHLRENADITDEMAADTEANQSSQDRPKAPEEDAGLSSEQRTGQAAPQLTDTAEGGAFTGAEPEDTVGEDFPPGRGPLSEEEQAMHIEEEA